MTKDLVSETRTVALSTSVTVIARNDPGRVAIIFSNMDTVNGIVGTLRSITTTVGILLQANGGFVNSLEREDGPTPKRVWFGISTATPTIYITEIRKISPASR